MMIWFKMCRHHLFVARLIIASFKENLMSKEQQTDNKDRVVHTVCNSHCGGTCDFKVHVRDGRIIRIESVPGENGRPGMCLRGHAYRQRVYSPDRILYPLKRSGKREQVNSPEFPGTKPWTPSPVK